MLEFFLKHFFFRYSSCKSSKPVALEVTVGCITVFFSVFFFFFHTCKNQLKRKKKLVDHRKMTIDMLILNIVDIFSHHNTVHIYSSYKYHTFICKALYVSWIFTSNINKQCGVVLNAKTKSLKQLNLLLVLFKQDEIYYLYYYSFVQCKTYCIEIIRD